MSQTPTVGTAALGRRASTGAHRQARRRTLQIGLWLFLAGNAVGVLLIWGSGGGDGLAYHWHSFQDVLLGLGRITALLAGYLALIEVILLARLPFLERLVGFDKLTIWHRWNGHAVIYLALTHVVFSVWGYAEQDGNSWFREYWNWLTLPQAHSSAIGGQASSAISSGAIGAVPVNVAASAHSAATSPYPGIITATIGTFLLVMVLVTSLVVVRRRLSYEWWYVVHFTAYAGIALAWFHMIPDGNDLVIDKVAADYWRSLYALTLALILWFRVARPLLQAWRLDLRVSEVHEEGPGVVSLRITGRNLDRLGAKAGQFFFWRFWAKGFWYTQHPFSLSEAPHGDSFRITVKNLGDHSARLGEIRVGTRVFAEGPFGVFTDDSRQADKAVLIAGGIGITPVRALIEDMDADVVVLYRAIGPQDIVFRDELDRIAKAGGHRVEYVVGDHANPEGRNLLTPAHLTELVPDIADRDVYVCGPSGMIDSIVPNLRRTSVTSKRLHVERFAL